MLQKLYQGNRERYPRWRDEKGNFAGWSRLFRNFPRAFVTGCFRIFFNVRPQLPWISYDAIDLLTKHLKPTSKVLEFGSGMSTIWYAKHAGEVYSVEDFEGWYSVVQEMLKKLAINNVHYFYATTPADYTQFGKKSENLFDLIMVDGSHRNICIKESLDLLAPGGILYLDNSDKDANGVGEEFRPAEQMLKNYALAHRCEVRYFTDFAPTQFFAQQGMLIQRPS